MATILGDNFTGPFQNPIPIKSSDLISTLFGDEMLYAIKNGKYRSFTEQVSPQVQGYNAKELADWVVNNIEQDKNQTLVNQANFFKEKWESGLCYLCGLPIEKEKDQQEELEHILPIGLALGLLSIINMNKTQFLKRVNFGSITENEMLLYLLEYARSHACCNQIKSSISFLKWNGENYVVDSTSIKHVLRKICKSNELELHQSKSHCGNTTWQTNMTEKYANCDNFIDTQYKNIKEYYINPILNNITEQFNKDENIDLTKLVFLANQAMGVNPKLWELQGTGTDWEGNTISRENLLIKIQERAMEIIEANGKNNKQRDQNIYDHTTGEVLNQILQLTEDFEFKDKMTKFLNNSDKGKRPKRVASQIDESQFKKHLVLFEYVKFVNIYQDYIDKRGEYIEIRQGNSYFLWWGNLYMKFLIEVQDKKFVFKTGMVGELAMMLINVHNFTLLNIFLYLIWYDPFSENGSFEAIDELNDKLGTLYFGQDKYLGLQDKYTNIFSRFTYNVVIDSFSYDFKVLHQFISYVLEIPLKLHAAKTTIEIAQTFEAAYNVLDLKDQTEAANILVGIHIAPFSPYTTPSSSVRTTPDKKKLLSSSSPSSPSSPSSQPSGSVNFNIPSWEFSDLWRRIGLTDGDRGRSRDRNIQRREDRSRSRDRVDFGNRSDTPLNISDYRGGFKSKNSLTMPIKRSKYYGKVNRTKIRRKSKFRETKRNKKKIKRNKTKKK